MMDTVDSHSSHHPPVLLQLFSTEAKTISVFSISLYTYVPPVTTPI